jgi:hypothetical protein
MMKMTKTIRLVLAIAMVAAATANAIEPKIKIKVKIKPVLTLAGLSMQVENVSVGAQAKDDLLAGTEKFAQGASSVTEVNLDSTTMGMLGDDHGPNADKARKLNFMVVRSYSYDKPGMYRAEDVDLFRKKIEDGSWSCPIHVRGQKDSSDICSRTGADHETNEMIILTVRPQKITVIHMSGKMSLNDLSHLSHSTSSLTYR